MTPDSSGKQPFRKKHRMNHIKLPAVIFLFLARPAWSVEATPMKITDGERAVAQGCNEFATDLYGRLRSEMTGNLFFSPYSISMALAMTYAGAEGKTEAQMAKVLHFPLPETKFHPAFNGLQKRLVVSGEAPRFQLRVANRLWGQKGFHFLTPFLQVTKDNYGAELGLLDFKQTEVARKTINSWVDKETDRKIQDLLAPGVLDASTRLVLTNAIYFKARWEDEFSKSATTDAPFHVAGQKQIKVPMMHQQRQLRYVESNNMQTLELPYAGYEGLSMLIVLPKKIDGLSDLEKALTSENVQKWSSGLKSGLVNAHLPKFQMTSEFSLADVLSSMGMSLAFSDKADFSGMSTQEPLLISAVIHKAFVDVNEEGTEAAAATAVGIGAAAELPRPEEPVEFRADHPFVFLIRDNRTQAVLFLGRLVNPKG
jgi:serpin B